MKSVEISSQKRTLSVMAPNNPNDVIMLLTTY